MARRGPGVLWTSHLRSASTSADATHRMRGIPGTLCRGRERPPPPPLPDAVWTKRLKSPRRTAAKTSSITGEAEFHLTPAGKKQWGTDVNETPERCGNGNGCDPAWSFDVKTFSGNLVHQRLNYTDWWGHYPAVSIVEVAETKYTTPVSSHECFTEVEFFTGYAENGVPRYDYRVRNDCSVRLFINVSASLYRDGRLVSKVRDSAGFPAVTTKWLCRGPVAKGFAGGWCRIFRDVGSNPSGRLEIMARWRTCLDTDRDCPYPDYPLRGGRNWKPRFDGLNMGTLFHLLPPVCRGCPNQEIKFLCDGGSVSSQTTQILLEPLSPFARSTQTKFKTLIEH